MRVTKGHKIYRPRKDSEVEILIKAVHVSFKSCQVMLISGCNAPDSTRPAYCSASGVTPSIWNMGAPALVANAAEKAFKASRAGGRSIDSKPVNSYPHKKNRNGIESTWPCDSDDGY